MSFIDEFKSDPAAWLARARAEPEEPLVGSRHLSLSVADAERLEEAVSGKSPSYDRPIMSAGSAALGSAPPAGGSRVTGGRSGTVAGHHDRRDERVGRTG